MAKKGSQYEKFVASVIEEMDDTVDVLSGQWVEGPDGRRDMDVQIRGRVNGNEYSVLIECKDYDPNKTGPVGIEFVDAIDSKRHDLNLDAALICSNSGFTAGALSKAKRKGIGLISILKAGDNRVKIEIKEVFYKFKIKGPKNIEDITFRFKQDKPTDVDLDNVTFEGLKVVNWIFERIYLIARANPYKSNQFYSTYDFKSPTKIDFGQIAYEVVGLDFKFHIEIQWFSDEHAIDASMGIYNFIRKKTTIGGPGPVQYVVKDVNTNELGTPIDFIPDKEDLWPALLPGEAYINIGIYEGFFLPDKKEIPRLDELIVSEDLELKVKDEN